MTPVKAVHHIGIAVRSISAQRGHYEGVLGAVFEGIEEVADQKVRVGYFRVGTLLLELVEPSDPTSPLASFLDRRGEGLHHIAFAVEHLEGSISEWKQAGLRMVDDTPRTGAHRLRIAFAHPSSTFGVLTELCEPPQE